MLMRISATLILIGFLFPPTSSAQQPDADLLEAVSEGDAKAVDRLLKLLGPELSDSTGRQALRVALEQGRVTILPRLIATGVDLNMKFQDGKTLLDVVATVPWPDLVERLLKAGAKKIKGGAQEVRTRPLFAVDKEDLQALKVWLDEPPDTTEIDVIGKLGLWWASRKPNLDFVRLFLEAGVDPDLRDESGTTMLMTAVAARRLDMVRLLAEAGADFDLENRKGKTAMELAEALGYDEILVIIINERISRKKKRAWGE